MKSKAIQKPLIGVLFVLMLLGTAVFPAFSASQTTVTLGYSSFEEPAASPNAYTDLGSAAVDHALANNTNEPTVNYTSVGGELGFSSSYINSRNSTGLTDGDDAGVTTNASSYPDGTQGFQMSDTDGMMVVTFDSVSLANVTNPQLAVDYFLGSTSWESNDVARIWVVADGSSEIDLLNTTGQDIDTLGIENSWRTLTADLSGVNTAVLKIALDSNSAFETLHVDNILFTGTQTNAPQLAVTQTVTAEPLLGGEMAFDITVRNSGDTPLVDRGYNLSVTSTLSAGVTFTNATITPTFVETQEDGSTMLVWENIADLEAGETLAIGITAVLDPEITAADQINSSVEATFNDAPDNSGEWLTATNTLTKSPQTIDIELSANQSTADEQATGAGEYDSIADWPYSYTATVSNNFVGNTDNVVATVTLPAGVAYMGNPQISPNPNGSSATPALSLESDGSLVLSWDLGTLTPTEYDNPVEITFDTAVPYKFRTAADTAAAAGSFAGPMSGSIIHEDAVLEAEYEATGTYSGIPVSDGTESTPDDDPIIRVIAEYLTVHKAVTPKQVGIGDTVTYSIDFYVSEYYDISNAYLIDIMPDGTTYVPSSASQTPVSIQEDTPGSGQTTIRWDLSSLQTTAGSSGTITFQATIDATYEAAPYTGQPVVSGDSLTNQVTIYDDWADLVTNGRYGTITPDTSKATVTTNMPALVKDVKHTINDTWGDTTPGFVGDTVTFRLQYDAAANVDAKEIVIRDFLPRGTSYIADSDSYSNSGSFSSSATCTAAPTAPTVGTLNGLEYVEWRLCNTGMGSHWETTIDVLVQGVPNVQPDWIVANMGKLTGQNSYGDIYSQRDLAKIEYLAPTLQLTKSASPNVGLEENDVVTYTLTIENIGDATAYNIAVTDTLPADLLVPNSGGSASPSSSSYTTISGNPSAGLGGVIEWSEVASLAAGEMLIYQYTATIPTGLIAGQSMSNQATVAYNSRPDNNGHQVDGTGNSEDENTDDETVYLRGLTVSKSANVANATIGDTVTWTIIGTVPNGVVAFWPVLEENNLPNGFDYVDGSTTLSGGALGVTFDPDHGSTPLDNGNADLRWFFSPITNTTGVEQTFSLSFDTLVTGVNGNNTDTTYYTCCDRNADNDAFIGWYDEISGYNSTGSAYDAGFSTSNIDRRSPEADGDVRIYQPRLTLSKSSDFTYVEAGGVLLFTLDIRNTGQATAYDVVVTDTLPAELTFNASIAATVTPDNGEIVTDNNVNGAQNLTYEIDQIPVGSIVRLQYSADVDALLAAGLEFANVAQVVSYSTQPGMPADSNGDSLADERSYVGPTDSVTLISADADILKTQTINGELTTGATMTYTLTVPATPLANYLYDVVVIDTVDDALQIVNVTNGNFDGNVVTATFDTIAIGAQEQIIIEVTVPTDGNGQDNTVILNQATLDHANGSGIVSNSVAQPLLFPALSVDANVSQASVAQNDVVTYTVRVTNKGHATAHNLAVQGVLPSNLSYVPGSVRVNDVAASDPVAGEFSLDGVLLYVGQSAELTFQARVNSVTLGEVYSADITATGENMYGLAIQADATANVANDDDPTDSDSLVLYGPLICDTDETHIAFEDLKNTGWSDWDYNDLIVLINTELCETNNGDAGIIEVDYTAVARGAGFTHSFRHDLPFAGSGRYTLTIFNHLGQQVSTKTVEFENLADIEIFADSKQIFEEKDGNCGGDFQCLSYVNTYQADTEYRVGYTANLVVVLDAPVQNAVATLPETPWDPYIYVFDTGEEVHRIIPGHLDNSQTVNSEFDQTTPLLSYDLPLVQTFDVSWDWPIEFLGIWRGYPDYVEHIKTGGTTNLDWFAAANQDTQYIWEHSPFRTLGIMARTLFSTESADGSRYFASPVVQDIDQDGRSEIIIGNLLADQVEVYDQTGQLLWTQNVNGGVKAAVAVADLDKTTAGFEVLVPSEDGYLYAFHADGTAVSNWPVRVGGTGPSDFFRVLSTPATADLDNDMEIEVVVAGSNGRLYVFNHDGSLLWEASLGDVLDSFGSQVINSSPIIADLDGDDVMEIAVGSFDKHVYAFDSDGNELWRFETGDVVMSSPRVADIDPNSDGNEIIFGSGDTHVYLLDESGELIWSYATGWSVRSSALVIDMDGDEALEIIIGSDDDKVYAFENDGSLVNGWPRTTGSDVFASAATGDVDGDGDDEIVIGSDDGNLYAWEMDGTSVANWPVNKGGSIKGTAVIVQLDGDAADEVVIGDFNGVLSIEGGMFRIYLPIVTNP